MADEVPRCGFVAGADGKITVTEACLDQILAEPLPPKRASMFHELAYALDERGNFQLAALLLDQALALEPSNARYLHERGYARTNLGQLPEALADLDAAIRHDPGFGLAIGQRAFVRYRLGDYAGALEDYDRTIEFDSGKIDYRFGRAASLIQLRRFIEAQDEMKRIETLPNSADAMRSLTNLMVGQLAEATDGKE